MAFNYQSKTWAISGEKAFDNGFTLLNPEIKVSQVVIREDMIYMTLEMHENGGVFNHSYNLQYMNNAGVTDLDQIVSDAIANAFPTAAEVVE